MLDFLFPKVYAQVTNSSSNEGLFSGNGISFDRLLANINNQIVTPLIYLMFAAALVYFLYGVFVFIRNADSPEERATGGKSIMWGLVGMFIMLSVKGIINLILGTIGVI
jgi:hypothetical protein